MAEPQAYRCGRCGAPLEVTPETIVAVCSYCGYPNWLVEEAKENIMIVPSLPEKDIMGVARKRIETDPDLRKLAAEITLGKPQLIYIPFYFVKTQGGAVYEGKVEVTYTVTERRGNQTRIVRKRRVVDVKGEIKPVTRTYPIVARRAVSGMSVRVIGSHYLRKPSGAKLLEQHRWTRSEATRVLSAEFTRATAELMAIDKHCNYLREMAVREMKSRAVAMVGHGSAKVLSRHIRCTARKAEASDLTLLPLWITPYYYRGTTYRFYIAGWDKAVLLAEEPMTAAHRIKYYALAAASSGVLGGAAVPALLYLEGRGAFGAAAALFMGGFLLNYYFARKMLSPVRVESSEAPVGGEGEGLGSVAEKVSGLLGEDVVGGLLGEISGGR